MAPRGRQRLWLRLFNCSAVLEQRIRTKLMEEFDTTLPRFGALAALARAPEGLKISDLSASVVVSGATMTGIIGRLVEEGLVTRRVESSDRRISIVKLTVAGRENFLRMAQVHGDWIEHVFADLTEKQIATLLKLLSVVRESIYKNLI